MYISYTLELTLPFTLSHTCLSPLCMPKRVTIKCEHNSHRVQMLFKIFKKKRINWKNLYSHN